MWYERAVLAEVSSGLEGTEAKLANRVNRPAPYGKPISREDPVVKYEPREEHALWLRKRLPYFMG